MSNCKECLSEEGGKVEAMNIAKRLVNAVLTDLIDGTPKERGGEK